jgi:hypothetical protein
MAGRACELRRVRGGHVAPPRGLVCIIALRCTVPMAPASDQRSLACIGVRACGYGGEDDVARSVRRRAWLTFQLQIVLK